MIFVFAAGLGTAYTENILQGKASFIYVLSRCLHLSTDRSGTLFISAELSPAVWALKGEIALDTPSASTLWPSSLHSLSPFFFHLSLLLNLFFIPALTDFNLVSASLFRSADCCTVHLGTSPHCLAK